MSVIDDVKQRVDIVDLVSQYVTLKRAGKSFTAACPFHSERTPSLHVDPARQTWHCFGACSTGGDIFAFVMKKEGCEFRDALRVLAERAGVSLEAPHDTQEDIAVGSEEVREKSIIELIKSKAYQTVEIVVQDGRTVALRRKIITKVPSGRGKNPNR